MIRIIDATLSQLDDYNLTREKIYSFIELMGGIGIRDLQLSINTYYTLDGELPDGYQYYLEVDTASYINQIYPSDDDRIRYFFTPKQKNREREIPSYHINDLEEPIRIEESHLKELMYVVGLDNLILGGCNAGMEILKKRFLPERMILCPEDTFHCATAIAVQFLQTKGYGVVSTMLGIGNKASTEQILMALHVIERYMINRNFSNFAALRDWLESALCDTISSMKPVLGTRIFYVESGVHVDGILKKSTNYEPYAPELVGLKREVILGKHSGKNSVLYKMEALRPDSTAKEHLDEILSDVKMKCRNRRTALSDEEFIKMIEGYERNETTS